MNNIIKKERIHLFSPSADICVTARINGAPKTSELQSAVNIAVSCHDILCSRVVADADGTARLEISDSLPAAVINGYDCAAEELCEEQERRPFDLANGETIRFFYRERDGELTVIAHHIIGDGNSLMIFMDDLLKALNGGAPEKREIRLLSSDDLPKHPKISLLMRTLIKQTNINWSNKGKVFTSDEYAEMFSRYWENNSTQILTKSFDEGMADKLLKVSHDSSVTLNSLIVAAFAATGVEGNIGVAVNIRPDGFKGMGNYATGITVKTKYDESMSLTGNAKAFHKEIKACIGNPKRKYFLYEFMNSLSPTLVDSMYFSMTGLFDNDISHSVRRMCGYMADPTGTSITNLTTVTAGTQAGGRYSYDTLYFVPPYIPNVGRVAGVSTYKGILTLTSHFPRENGERESEIFSKVCAILENTVD